MENRTFIKTFFNRFQAYDYLDNIMTEYDEKYHVREAKIEYINYQWRVGVLFEKKEPDLFEYIDMNDIVD